MDLGLEHDIIQKSGSWYSHGENRIGQGRDATKQWLSDNPEKREEVKQAIKDAMGMGVPKAAPPVEEDEEIDEAILDL